MIQVVAAIIERHGLILICQRRPTDPHPLKWEFPGGKVEPGETPQDALRRELREELGIEAVVGAEISRYVHQYPQRAPIELIFYRIPSFEGDPQNLVFSRMEWEQPERLREYDFLEGDREFLRTWAGGP